MYTHKHPYARARFVVHRRLELWPERQFLGSREALDAGNISNPEGCGPHRPTPADFCNADEDGRLVDVHADE
jgi:hypothetical protein